MTPHARVVAQALRDLQRNLPGRYPAKLEALLMAADSDAQLEFVLFARNIAHEIIAAEQRGRQQFMKTGRP